MTNTNHQTLTPSQSLKEIKKFSLSRDIHVNNHHVSSYQKFLKNKQEGNSFQYEWRALIPFFYIYHKMYIELFVIVFFIGMAYGLSPIGAVLVFLLQPFIFLNLYYHKCERVFTKCLKKYNKFQLDYAAEIEEEHYLKNKENAKKVKNRKKHYFKYSSLDLKSMFFSKVRPLSLIGLIPMFITTFSLSLYCFFIGASYTNQNIEDNFALMTNLATLSTPSLPYSEMSQADKVIFNNLEKMQNFPDKVMLRYTQYYLEEMSKLPE